MKAFLAKYENPNEKRINFNLMRRAYDKPLIDYIHNVCKSLQSLSQIEFMGIRVVDDESNIDMNDYISSRKKTSKKTTTKYMYLKNSRYAELHLLFKLTCKGDVEYISKKLLIPVPDSQGYYTIKGNKYHMLYQLVDASTYTTRQNLTLKSLMPVTITRVKKEFKDTEGGLYTAPSYMVYIFKKKIEIFLLYFAKIGMTETLKYFKVDRVIKVVEAITDKTNNLYFQISTKMFLEVDKYFFLEYQYVQSMVAMILDKEVVTNRLTFENIDDQTYWVNKVGGKVGGKNATKSAAIVFNLFEKGTNLQGLFERMVDETTKEILKLNPENKKNIYSITRWMIQNFNALRKKDNLDLGNKRLRCNEYIASLLTREINTRVNRIAPKGDKLDLKKLKEIFSFPGDVIIKQMYSSGLLRFDDDVNDMDFFSKFKYTLKGPNAIGAKNDNKISVKYRDIHPSFIGRIDLNVCGTTDPGSSGVLTPFCETDGLYFDGSNEPEDGIFSFEKDFDMQLRVRNPEAGYISIFDNCETIEDAFRILGQNNEITQIVATREMIETEHYITAILPDRGI